MNAVAATLVWLAVQSVLFCLLGTGVYLLARRRHPALGAWVAACVLGALVAIPILGFAPGPRWGSLVDPLPAVVSSAEVAASVAGPAEPIAVEPTEIRDEQPRTKALAEAPNSSAARNANRPRWSPLPLLSRAWQGFRRQLAVTANPPTAAKFWSWPTWIGSLMCALVAVGIVRTIGGYAAVRRLNRRAVPLYDPEMLAWIAEFHLSLGCRRPVVLREYFVGSRGGSPAVIGWLKPAILLPSNWREWSRDVRRTVLAHEMTHVARGDFGVWLIAQAGVALHYFNPLVHWLAHRLRLEQELACDLRAAAIAGGPQSYLLVLADMALSQDLPKLSWAGRPFVSPRSTFMRRIEMLHRRRFAAEFWPSRWTRTFVLMLLVVGGLTLAGLRGPALFAKADNAETEHVKFDLGYVPPEAIFALSVKPTKLTAVPGFDEIIANLDHELPFMGITWSPPTVGLSRLTDVLVGLEDIRISGNCSFIQPIYSEDETNADKSLPPAPPEFSDKQVIAIAFRASQPQDWMAVYKAFAEIAVANGGEKPEALTPVTILGQTCYYYPVDAKEAGPTVFCWAPDDRSLLLVAGTRAQMEQAMTPDRQTAPAFVAKWREFDSGGLALALSKEMFGDATLGFEDLVPIDLDNPVAADAFSQGLTAGMSALDSSVGVEQTESATGAAEVATLETIKQIGQQFAKVEAIFARVNFEKTIASVAIAANCDTAEVAGLLAECLQTLKMQASSFYTGAVKVAEALTTVDEATLVQPESPIDVRVSAVERMLSVEMTFASELVEQWASMPGLSPDESKALQENHRLLQLASVEAASERITVLLKALNEYKAQHGAYPPSAVIGPDGKTVHSWRVALLPYLGEQSLYDDYRLDEPWDSEHNHALVQRLPTAYNCQPGRPKTASDFALLTNGGVVSEGQRSLGVSLGASPAQASETAESGSDVSSSHDLILLIHGFQDYPWTKPRDVELTVEAGDLQAKTSLVGWSMGYGGLVVGYANGTSRFITCSAEEPILVPFLPKLPLNTATPATAERPTVER